MKNLLIIAIQMSLIVSSLVCINGGKAQLVDELLFEDPDVDVFDSATKQSSAAVGERHRVDIGEDLGQRQAENNDWVAKAIKHMEFAQIALTRPRDANQASVAQTAALSELDSMIAALNERKKQCGGDQSALTGTPRPAAKPSSPGQAGSQPSELASSPGSVTNSSTELAVAGELVKDLWGQLPKRQRDQILQPLREDFLPKYAREIEAYYRALANPDRTVTESP